jgi:hypothetical protein
MASVFRTWTTGFGHTELGTTSPPKKTQRYLIGRGKRRRVIEMSADNASGRVKGCRPGELSPQQYKRNAPSRKHWPVVLSVLEGKRYGLLLREIAEQAGLTEGVVRNSVIQLITQGKVKLKGYREAVRGQSAVYCLPQYAKMRITAEGF